MKYSGLRITRIAQNLFAVYRELTGVEIGTVYRENGKRWKSCRTSTAEVSGPHETLLAAAWELGYGRGRG